ncbi:toxin-antitoxin system YwqK family antitoxin [Chitinophagaceae bacterium LB-8]|uniref:Toxin-antitoxin system YwqK family antitoxin n=1 Tax=Paraflavisolibacter caeni TaxID=2982496 RepID=A0A9X2XYI1_9BACT|nr:toxin-antitoxin system YwqK family antitoxin [Paraflavisolibacter caeni]MCU7551206.1 toxin-antitoxin system YwqK family antitoxin [Paraflavisolibacter caeni]
MSKLLLFLFGFFSIIVTASGQSKYHKILYILDSIPLVKYSAPWDPILPEDIADYSVITNRDSLRLLGWKEVDSITYFFTKAYRSRADSVRRIPSLKQMVLKEGVWTLRGIPYSGRYIDYYNNGKIQNEGTLLNGKLDGAQTYYNISGIKILVTNYKNGIMHGLWMDYYPNGSLMRLEECINGKPSGNAKLYFNNGQIKQELRLKKETGYDTSITYYSTGKIRRMALSRTGVFKEKKEAALTFHTAMFYEYLRTGNLKGANKSFYRIWLIDSASIDTYFKEGLLLSREFRFDEAIAQFDRALTVEPLMPEALEQRVLARIKKYKFENLKTAPQDNKYVIVTLEDFMLMPEAEKAKVCSDLLLASELYPGVNYISRAELGAIFNYCKKQSIR